MSDEMISKTDDEWKQELTSEQYEICRKKGTEPAFSGRYWNVKDIGVYRCICCGNDLFSSDTKYDSGTGWPSFWATINNENVRTKSDNSFGMIRDEVVCNKCDAHLGHLFDDGPPPSHKRYCVNSASIILDKDVHTP